MNNVPKLFGIVNSNRDFSKKESWGKNQFNSSFPIALCCFLDYMKLKSKYIHLNSDRTEIVELDISEAFGIDTNDSNLLFSFETPFNKFQKYVYGKLPRNDVVIQNNATGDVVSSFEIKLTALPDHTTCDLTDDLFGSEIVVRPDTIVYIACILADNKSIEFSDFFDKYKDKLNLIDWGEAKSVLLEIEIIRDFFIFLKHRFGTMKIRQKPFLIQPIWKTCGKSSKLSANCLDVFIWSELAFCEFIFAISNLNEVIPTTINRQLRTAIWLFKMIFDYYQFGKFNHHDIIDKLSYNTRNDKAFASSGTVTNKFMSCPELIKPRIKREQIKEIILGGGQHLLSPERRFDAIIHNSPDIF